MRKWMITLALVMASLPVSSPVRAQDKLNVFACEPEWAALAGEIGGEAVIVHTASTARQNVHFLRARPGLLAAMRKADLVFCNGASLEAGWLPLLVQKAGRATVQPGKSGYFLAADHVNMRNIPARVDRAMGDVHPEGNPHILLDPANIRVVAAALADRLAMIDPYHADAYRRNLARFDKGWTVALAGWNRQASGLKGMKVVVYHTGWDYLLGWLGIESVASLEPKPGIPPTLSHLETVLAAVKDRDIRAILVAPFEDPEAAQWLSGKTGIPVVYLPYTVGGNARADTLENLFTETLRLLREASS